MDEGDRVVVRGLVEADVPQVTAIEAVSFATPWSPDTFRNLLKRTNARLLAAVAADDALVGYAAIWFAGRSGELGDLAVHPDARRRGVGTKLVRAALEEGRAFGARDIFLEVRATNTAAQGLYRRQGFVVVGRRPGYYADPKEDALVMRRSTVERSSAAHR